MSRKGLNEQIFPITFELFAQNGFDQVELVGIAAEVGVCSDVLQELFPTKEALILATGKWKMESIATKVDVVVNMELPILEKLVKYVEVMYQSLSEASYKVAVGMFIWQDDFSVTMKDYLKEAVYGRFSKMIDEANQAKLLKSGLDPADALFQYWDMLSSILAMNLSDQMPLEICPEKTISDVVCGEIIRVYKQVLNAEATEEIDKILSQHPLLSRISA